MEAWKDEEQTMPKAVIEDWNRFSAFLSAQPLCQWSAQKQHEIDTGMISLGGSSIRPPPAKKDDNADLMAALSSMA